MRAVFRQSAQAPKGRKDSRVSRALWVPQLVSWERSCAVKKAREVLRLPLVRVVSRGKAEKEKQEDETDYVTLWS